MSARAKKHAAFDEDDNLVINVQEGELSPMMRAENQFASRRRPIPGRVWGFVPRDRLMGRAWVVGWAALALENHQVNASSAILKKGVERQ